MYTNPATVKVCQLKNKKAAGIDKIPIELFRSEENSVIWWAHKLVYTI